MPDLVLVSHRQRPCWSQSHWKPSQPPMIDHTSKTWKAMTKIFAYQSIQTVILFILKQDVAILTIEIRQLRWIQRQLLEAATRFNICQISKRILTKYARASSSRKKERRHRHTRPGSWNQCNSSANSTLRIVAQSGGKMLRRCRGSAMSTLRILIMMRWRMGMLIV